MQRGNFEGKGMPPQWPALQTKLWRELCKKAEPIEMPFGL